MLSVWVADANQKRVPLTQAAITEKTRSIFDNPKETDEDEEIL